MSVRWVILHVLTTATASIRKGDTTVHAMLALLPTTPCVWTLMNVPQGRHCVLIHLIAKTKLDPISVSVGMGT